MEEKRKGYSTCYRSFKVNGMETGYYSVSAFAEELGVDAERLPLTVRIMLESLLRNFDGQAVKKEDIEALASWKGKDGGGREVPFIVSRVLMQDFTGVPAVVDLAVMREVMSKMGKDPLLIQPHVPVELVIDHSIQVDSFGEPASFTLNREKEFERNRERYVLLKWASRAFRNFTVMPPSLGIVHQVNLEYLARCVHAVEEGNERIAYPDTLVGTDSHTTMVNGIGVLGFGVGGIEAEAAMLGQPVALSQPSVVGVKLKNRLREGVTATDLVLTVTSILRSSNVVGSFIEFFGEGVSQLSVPDRATVSNMCPEYGATAALFPTDAKTADYLMLTGRKREQVELVMEYMKAQNFSDIDYSKIDYSRIIEIDLAAVRPSVAGPGLPQARLDLSQIGPNFISTYFDGRGAERAGREAGQRLETNGGTVQVSSDAEGRAESGLMRRIEIEYPKGRVTSVGDGDVVIAAITSCTNTSNPYVMIAAGLLAKKAVELGLSVRPTVKTSLAPGSRVVTEYLQKAGLMQYLEQLGFYLVGYGCTTCIGNSGPLPTPVSAAINSNGLTVASVLSGNRNFEGRIHPDVRASYLMSPPLVVAFAIAGSVTKDLTAEPLGRGRNGDVRLSDIWPSTAEIEDVLRKVMDPAMYVEKYRDFDKVSPEWNALNAPSGVLFEWDPESTYIQPPPFFEHLDRHDYTKNRMKLRVLAVFGDSVTTDHISPAGNFSPDTPAGRYLIERGVRPEDFNTYGSRRGNDRVMVRGTFANKRIRNMLVPGTEGGFTVHFPEGTRMSIFDASELYRKEGVELAVIAGREYGTGSSRDWAAKGPLLLGVRAIIARSFERIHRSNLIGMGILPLEFSEGEDASSLQIDFSQFIEIELPDELGPGKHARLNYSKKGGGRGNAVLAVRLDNEMEAEYYKAGGILHYVIRRLVS